MRGKPRLNLGAGNRSPGSFMPDFQNLAEAEEVLLPWQVTAAPRLRRIGRNPTELIPVYEVGPASRRQPSNRSFRWSSVPASRRRRR